MVNKTKGDKLMKKLKRELILKRMDEWAARIEDKGAEETLELKCFLADYLKLYKELKENIDSEDIEKRSTLSGMFTTLTMMDKGIKEGLHGERVSKSKEDSERVEQMGKEPGAKIEPITPES